MIEIQNEVDDIINEISQIDPTTLLNVEFIVRDLKFKKCAFAKKSKSASKTRTPGFFTCDKLRLVLKIRYYKDKISAEQKFAKCQNYMEYADSIGMRCSIIESFLPKQTKKKSVGDKRDRAGKSKSPRIRRYRIITLMDIIDSGNSVDEAINGSIEVVDRVHLNLMKLAVNFDHEIEMLGLCCIDGQPRNFAVNDTCTKLILIDEENLVKSNDSNKRDKIDFLNKFDTCIRDMREERGIKLTSNILYELNKLLHF